MAGAGPRPWRARPRGDPPAEGEPAERIPGNWIAVSLATIEYVARALAGTPASPNDTHAVAMARRGDTASMKAGLEAVSEPQELRAVVVEPQRPAHEPLVVLMGVPLIAILSFPLVPMLYALGRAGDPLKARIIASVLRDVPHAGLW